VQYGPDAHPARDPILIRRATAIMVDRIWRQNASQAAKNAAFTATSISDEASTKIGELAPQDDFQRSLKARAVQLSSDVALMRLLLFEQGSKRLP
jgi:hypothetical protein